MAICKLLDTGKAYDPMPLPDAISTVLHRMVKRGEMEYSENTTPRGGHIYRIKRK